MMQRHWLKLRSFTPCKHKVGGRGWSWARRTAAVSTNLAFALVRNGMLPSEDKMQREDWAVKCTIARIANSLVTELAW